MSESHKTTGRPLASIVEKQQQPEQHIVISTASATDKRRKRQSTSSNGTLATTKSTSPRRRSGVANTITTSSNVASSRAAQQSTPNPNNMSPVNYTKTGRVSKAKKGLKVHDCECGRSYTRAEHLRRHQRNHAQEGVMNCKYPNCSKTFFRSDLLQRHEERHDELSNVSRRPSLTSTEHSAHTSPSTAPATLPAVGSITTPPAMPYPQHAMSPQPEITSFPRYNQSLFRAPQVPRTPKTTPSNFSNHVFHSSHIFKTPTNDFKHQDLAWSTRHSISGPILAEGRATCGAWHDSFAQSPYSSSSGYASPAPCPEYSQIYATPPFRTRASSTASFVEQTWPHASNSPISSASIPYSWPSDEKSMVSSSFPFVPVTYPTSSMPGMDALSNYAHYDPRNVAHMDNEEGIQLFPGEHYGMSQIARAYPFEQWLNNYWRLFHPTFPVVHRFTLACGGELSPMLYAAMIAIDLQYSDEVGERRKAMELHKSCARLLLQREQLGYTGCDRLCDDQAIFLVEIFSQYCAQRCSKTLSARFQRLYKKKLAGIRAVHPSAIFGLQLLDPAPEKHIHDRWVQWSQLSAKQNLLLSCYVLESQQQTLLARHCPSALEGVVDNLPFPVHDSLWSARSASEWAAVAQQHLNMPETIQEAFQLQPADRYNVFQSAVLIATCYDQSSGPAPILATSLEHVLSQSTTTQLQLLTTKLAQLVPLRALLAVSGETWVLGTKLTSKEECSSLNSILRAWTNNIWSSTTELETNSTLEALSIAIAILNCSLETDNPSSLGLGNKMCFFFAALVLWAATAAASNRVGASGISSQHLQAPCISEHDTVNLPHTAAGPSTGQQMHHPAAIQHSPFSNPSKRRLSIPWVEIFSQTSLFLSTAMSSIASLDIAACHTGCTSLLLWTKMHLRGAFSTGPDSAATDACSSGHYRGEIVNEAISQIERMLDHDWERWGI